MCSSQVIAYPTEETTQVTINSTGLFTGSTNIGVAYEIQGNPGGTGSVTAQIYNGNPQSTASIPEGVLLTRFVVVIFNMYQGDFNQAKIYITYTDEDVANLQAPYSVYKYVTSSNSYVEVPSTVDTTAKLVTVLVTSIDDQLFAIGGAAASSGNGGFSTIALVILAVAIVIIVVLAVFGVWYFKKRSV
jgi:hypothetical protein